MSWPWKPRSQARPPLLPQPMKEFSQILGEKLRLLHSGKMAAFGHGRPAHDVEAALGKRPGRHRNLLGEERYRNRGSDAVREREAKRPLARFIVQTCGRMDGFCRPVNHHIGQELVPSEDALEIARTVAPGPELLNDPGCEPDRGIVEAVTERLRLRSLEVAVAALAVPPGPELSEIGICNLVVLRLIQRAAEKKAAGDIVEVNADDALSMIEAKGDRNGRTPIAALGGEALVAERIHQACPECCNLVWIHTSLARTVGEPVARQRGHDNVEGVLRPSAVRRGVGQERNKLYHLDEAARPTMCDDQGERCRSLAAHMHKVHPEPIECDSVVGELVECRLLSPPVVAIPPVASERLHVDQTRA